MDFENYELKIGNKKFTIKNLAIFISCVFVILLISAWDARVIWSIDAEFLGLHKTSIADISNFVTWQKLIFLINSGDIFLNSSDIFKPLSLSVLIPYLSLWVSSLVIGVLGLKASYLIVLTVIPTFCYYLMVRIFNTYLPLRWSIFMGFLGIIAIDNYPFREFLVNTFLSIFTQNRIEVANELSLSITSFPFPTLSLLCFLYLFYKSLGRENSTSSGHLILSVLWGLQAQVHILNLLFGVPFWTMVLLICYWRRLGHSQRHTSAKFIIQNLLVLYLLSAPVMLSLLSSTFTSIQTQPNSNLSFDWFTLTAYFIIPVFMTVICYIAFRIDKVELWYRFTPIWVTMLVELFLIISWQVFGFGVPTEMLVSRLGLFFLHISYYIPPVYFLQRVPVKYSQGIESKKGVVLARTILHFLIGKASIIYLPILILFLGIFVAQGSKVSFEKFTTEIKPQYEKATNEITRDASYSSIGKYFYGHTAFSNLIIISKTTLPSLWTNAFTSSIDFEERLKRFALYGKLVGWSKDEFIGFMSPDKTFSDRIENKVFSNEPIFGLGHWLLFDKSSQKRILKGNYLDRLSVIYDKEMVEQLSEMEIQ